MTEKMDRKNMEFFHVVTERPMHLGQQIFFDEIHHSGVYDRVMEKKALVEKIYAEPEQFAGKELDHHTLVALRELALEEVRCEKYPGYPSRMSSLYVSKTLEEANKWFDFFTGIGRPTFQIVKVRVNGRVFEGNANNCFDGGKDKNANMELAEKYWQCVGLGDEQAVREILVDGMIEVVEIVMK